MEVREHTQHRDIDAHATKRKRLRPWRACPALPVILLAAGCTRVDTGPPIVATRSTVAVPQPVRRDWPRAWSPSRTIELGRSVRGVPLVLEIFGDGPNRVFIFGGIHGDEPFSAVLARKLVQYLRVQPDAVAGRTVGILAEANPDGLAANRRFNASGVDLNRNFPARNWRQAGGKRAQHGPRPASEPETRAIMRAMEIIRPERIVSIHSARYSGQCNNYDGPARELAELMAGANRYPVKASMGYSTPGSFGSWAGIDRGIPIITLELPGGRSGTRCWRENGAALLAFIQAPGDIAAN